MSENVTECENAYIGKRCFNTKIINKNHKCTFISKQKNVDYYNYIIIVNIYMIKTISYVLKLKILLLIVKIVL